MKKYECIFIFNILVEIYNETTIMYYFKLLVFTEHIHLKKGQNVTEH